MEVLGQELSKFGDGAWGGASIVVRVAGLPVVADQQCGGWRPRGGTFDDFDDRVMY